ncbi:RNA polymerase sigma factor [Bacillus horti]|uniref:RNA polymerase sigma-70 factor (ECF subfamily) n=1 Tax=Caldalkalibacillus horti TaxID=77523 RepID=A0ABT9VWK4_9BACI|nr:RNA polymerase sigma factor [Bacillus horti]MDQ0165275.1 RNA polymerase sigma-70 factor (ECF subfamily) [Bacillus horti]
MDKEEVKELYLEYHQDVFNFLVYLSSHLDVEDLLQEVFIKLYKSHYQLDHIHNPKSLLFTIARHVVIDHQRKKKFMSLVSIDRLYDIASEESGPPEKLEIKEEAKEIFRLLDTLKREYREVIVLRKIQGFSVEKTAVILGWKESKVKITLHRAIKKLMASVQKEEGIWYEKES